jgi:CPA1 family monovalent cation:H+ antiporter
MFDMLVVLISLAALFGYLNARFIRLPTGIGVMAITLALSLFVIGFDELGLTGIEADARYLIKIINFPYIVLKGMLSLLLFAGALHIDLDELASRKWPVTGLATVGTLASAVIVGLASWFLLRWLSIPLSTVQCLLLGTLISPTDPVAVLALLKATPAPRSLEIIISGEALFNDGIAVVLFTVLLNVAGGAHTGIGGAAKLFIREVGGGAALGLSGGAIACWMLKGIEDYQIEVLITLALALGGYAWASHLGVSGPIAMVVAGLLIGNHGRFQLMSNEGRQYLDHFWEIVDAVLNMVLFVLVGLEVIMLKFTAEFLLLSLLLIPIVLTARLACVGVLVKWGRRKLRVPSHHAVTILTWAGLRGGVSLALALSLPQSPHRDLVLVATYTVVVFSILVQGLTLGKLVRWVYSRTPEALYRADR